MAIRATAGSSPLTRGKPCAVRIAESVHGLIPAHAGKTRYFSWESIALPAHPRSRGENEAATRDADEEGGSSPLTRGKLSDRRKRLTKARLIPAHAGKTTQEGGTP